MSPPKEIEQWVDKVTSFSSQYDDSGWKADHLCGKPNVYPQYGDIHGAWATGVTDANQFAEVKFKKSVYVVGIDIYETFHAGGIKHIAALDDRQWVTLWKTDKVTDIGQSRIFSPPLKPTNFKTKVIRIEIDCTAAKTWVEIDAIKLIGKKEKSDSDSDDTNIPKPVKTEPGQAAHHGPIKEQWVKKVKKYSSQYDDHSWKADHLRGKPNVYPQYGDIKGAWATGITDANQFAEVEFKKAVNVVGIDIYEIFHAGGTKHIAALNDKKQWVTLWKTDKVTDIGQARIFSPPLKETDFKTKDIRIEIDCTAAGTWVEIDAIKLKGRKVYADSSDSSDSDSDSEDEKKKKNSKETKSGKIDSDSANTNIPKPVKTEPGQAAHHGPIKEQWVKKVKKYSSQYDDHSWKADHLRGKPNVYPQYGDIKGAWATGITDANQFAEVEFKKAVNVVGIDIYEIFHAGGTKHIAALNDNKQWVTLWKTNKVTDIGKSRIFSPPLKETDFKTKDIRIEIDCTAAGTWVEIDAIKLKGRKDYADSSDSSDSDSDSEGEKKKKKKKSKKETKSRACVVL